MHYFLVKRSDGQFLKRLLVRNDVIDYHVFLIFSINTNQFWRGNEDGRLALLAAKTAQTESNITIIDSISGVLFLE